jgi:hypothetical protein
MYRRFRIQLNPLKKCHPEAKPKNPYSRSFACLRMMFSFLKLMGMGGGEEKV